MTLDASDSSSFTVVSHGKGRKLGVPLAIRAKGRSENRIRDNCVKRSRMSPGKLGSSSQAPVLWLLMCVLRQRHSVFWQRKGSRILRRKRKYLLRIWLTQLSSEAPLRAIRMTSLRGYCGTKGLHQSGDGIASFQLYQTPLSPQETSFCTSN